jgi:transcription termination factor Rho
MMDMNPIDAMETIKQALGKFKTNEEFLSTLK